MTDNNEFYNELFNGLKELAESSFPKKCANCGRTFETADQFFKETKDINTSTTGLKQSEDDDGTKILEVFRNCTCGSTLMDFFSDRRDFSGKGTSRRNKFEELLIFIVKNGIERNIARKELLKVMRGEKSEILSTINPPSKK